MQTPASGTECRWWEYILFFCIALVWGDLCHGGSLMTEPHVQLARDLPPNSVFMCSDGVSLTSLGRHMLNY